MTEIKVKNVEAKLVNPPKRVIEPIYEKLGYMRKGDEYSPKVASGQWDGVRRLFNKRWKTFPSGLIGPVREVLDMYNVEYTWDDMRVKPKRNRGWRRELPEDWDGLRYYQEETIETCMEVGRGVCGLPTASGKTVTFSCLIAELGIAPTIVYVPSLLLLKQTAADIEEFVRDETGEPVKVGVVGNGKCDIQEITVMTVQTAITAFNMEYDRNKGSVKKLSRSQIKKRREQGYKAKRRNLENPDYTEDMSFLVKKKQAIRELIKSAKVVICDEAHRAASFIYQEVLKNSNAAYYRFAFSATPWREDGTGMLITASFGRTIYEKTHSELVTEGFLARPYVFVVEVPDCCKPRAEMDTYHEVHKKAVVKCAARNRLLANIAKRACLHGPTMMLVKERAQGRALEALIPNSKFIHGASGKEEKEQAIADMLAGELPVMIATPIGDEGLDLVQLKVLILCDSGRSETKAYQRIGRTSRKAEGKEFSIIIDTRDSIEYLTRHARERESVYLSEPEWVVMRITPDGWRSLEI